MDYPIYKAVINPDIQSDVEVNFIALVDKPAIERNFLAFNKQTTYISKFAINEEKRIISGAAMIADMPIYRKDDVLGEYYVVFDAASIQDIVQKFSAKGFMTNFNLFHDEKTALNDITIFNSFISNTDLGIYPPEGFSDCANGSWFISAKVNNDAVWERIKSGELRGFSVEGLFNYIPIKEKRYSIEQAHALIEKILSETDFGE
jgi:hypothetical protein